MKLKIKKYNKVKKEKRESNKWHYLGTVTRGRRGWRRWERMEEVEECWREERVGIDLAAEKIDRERDPERHAISVILLWNFEEPRKLEVDV